MKTTSFDFKTPDNPHFPQTSLTPPFISFTGYFLSLHLLNVRARWARSSDVSSTLLTPTPLLTIIRWIHHFKYYLHDSGITFAFYLDISLRLLNWILYYLLLYLDVQETHGMTTTKTKVLILYHLHDPRSDHNCLLTQNCPYLYMRASPFLLLWPTPEFSFNTLSDIQS